MRSAQANLRIGVALNRELKAVRDEIAGIFGYASRRPHWEVRLLDRKQSPREFRRFAESWRLDGLIVDDRAHDLLGERTRRTCPTVFIDSCRPHEHSVEIDNRSIAERAADILLRRHYASYAFVGTDDRYAERHSREREAAFFSRIAAAGFACSTFVLASSDAKRIAGESQRLVQWLKALPKPCGLLVCSDLFAKTVYDACRRARLSVPDQLAILGVDNEIEIDEQLTPSLSSVLPDFTGAGRLAAELLEKALNRRRAVRRKLHARYGVKCVVERESTQDARGAGQLVAAARELIRAQALSGITVESVVQSMNISRRLLERRFREIVGHSIRDEILGIRLDEVRRQLTETGRSIDSITYACGWKSPTALKILFKRRFGLSLSDYRKGSRPRRRG